MVGFLVCVVCYGWLVYLILSFLLGIITRLLGLVDFIVGVFCCWWFCWSVMVCV